MKKNVLLISIFVSFAAFLVYVALSEKSVTKKNQEPRQPYPYYSENVKFGNSQADITLSGTLTLPRKEGNFPVVILVTGSGPQDRNEEVFGHKPFLVIADHLTRQGIAVLRYDDRGVGKSTGNFIRATSLDFATDAQSAVAYLKTRKEINPDKIGIVGHSEGGLVAGMAASRSKDINFVVSLAAPGVICYEVMTLQAELIARASGASQTTIAMLKKINNETLEIISKSTDTTLLRSELGAYVKKHLQDYPSQLLPPGQTKEQYFENQINAICTPWYQFLYKTDPAVFFGKITCPLLALNGTKDLQVDARQNLPAILKAAQAGGNIDVTIKELPDLNHFFQESKTGHPSEYAGNEQTFSPVALAVISDWILSRIQR